jgi:anion-transporting  ArsA/GET3 family ATPase
VNTKATFLFILVFVLSYSAFGTTFRVQSLEQQMSEAQGILIGHYLREQSIRLESGRIATQKIFQIEREFGLQSDFLGMKEVIVHYPGGQVDDEHVLIQGVPEFIAGEKVVILTKSHNNRFWGLNLGMGAFKIINYGEKDIMVNTLFPNHPKLGQYPLSELEPMVREIKKSELKIVSQKVYPTENKAVSQVRFPASVSERKIRSIASNTDEGDNNTAGSLGTFWLLALLAFLGVCFRFIHRNS